MSETQNPPKLSVVDAPVEVADARPSEPSAPARPSGTRWIAWLLLAAAVVFAWQWLTQLSQVEALEAELGAVRGELTEARAEIRAWEGHSVAVRSAVAEVTAGIAAQLGGLQELVSDAPGAPAPTSDAGVAVPEASSSGSAVPLD